MKLKLNYYQYNELVNLAKSVICCLKTTALKNLSVNTLFNDKFPTQIMFVTCEMFHNYNFLLSCRLKSKVSFRQGVGTVETIQPGLTGRIQHLKQ